MPFKEVVTTWFTLKMLLCCSINCLTKTAWTSFLSWNHLPIRYYGWCLLMSQTKKRYCSWRGSICWYPFLLIKPHLLFAESFGFAAHLTSLTACQAFSQCEFDHWGNLNGDPLHATSKVTATVTEIRKRKGLKESISPLDNFVDRIWEYYSYEFF